MAEMPPGRTGIVYLVGAGPGDPGLLTVRARTLLDECDAIVFDALVNPQLLDGQFERAIPARAVELHDVGKRGGRDDSARQQDINVLLIRLAQEGKRVVRLKGGDPFVFGRGSEEALALAAADVPFEVVPGVTAGIAAAAYAGIPVTHRGLATSVTFVTGSEDPAKAASSTDWHALAHAGGTLVLYMGVRALPEIARALLAGGLASETPAAAVEWGTYGRQRTIAATLGSLAARVSEAALAPPVITVIGQVVDLRRHIAWFERRPLFGRRILVTRAQPQASALSRRLAAAGADVVEAPATRIEPVDARELHAAIERLEKYGWVIFTSQNAVELFWLALRDARLDARALARSRVAAVGPGTADALLARGIAVDVVPARYVAEGLLAALGSRNDVQGARVLYVAAEGARDVLPKGLAELGARVDRVPIYRVLPDESRRQQLRERLERNGLALVTLTSASSVDALVGAVGAEVAARVPVASIGPVTSEAARRAGLIVALEATTSTIPGLVEAIVHYFAARPRTERGDA